MRIATFLSPEIARAYGHRAYGAPGPQQGPQPGAPVAGPASVARINGAPPSAGPSEVAGIQGPGEATPTKLPSAAQRLVAGVVPGGIDFSTSQPTPSGAALPMYAHPADKNEAAVAVRVGSSLDVTG